MPNIIVETHPIIKNEMWWRTGCVLQKDDSEALITSYQNRITITVIGEHKKKREFMSVIRFIINSINQKLRPVELIPLPGVKNEVKYEILLAMEKAGKLEYLHDEYLSTQKSFNIKKLLDGIEETNDPQLIHKIYEYVKSIKGDTEKIVNMLNLYFDELIRLSGINKTEIIDAIEELNEQQTTEITREIITWITTAFGIFNDEIDNKLKEFSNKSEQTDDVKMKLRLSIPFMKILGIDLITEFDVKNWVQKMHKKYEVKIFELMGAI